LLHGKAEVLRDRSGEFADADAVEVSDEGEGDGKRDDAEADGIQR